MTVAFRMTRGDDEGRTIVQQLLRLASAVDGGDDVLENELCHVVAEILDVPTIDEVGRRIAWLVYLAAFTLRGYARTLDEESIANGLAAL